MYKIIPTTQFKKDLKLMAKQGKNLNELNTVIQEQYNESCFDPDGRGVWGAGAQF